MFTSIGSRSSSSTRASTASWDIGSSSRTGHRDTVPPHACTRPFPRGSAGGPPPPPTRSRAATSTTTGGAGSTTPSPGCKESSGDCCDSWHRWPEDVALLKELGLHRLPLQPRVEPHRAGRGRVLHRGARPLRPPVRGPARGGHRPGGHVPPLHHARCGSPTRAAGRATTCPSASPPTARRPPPASTG